MVVVTPHSPPFFPISLFLGHSWQSSRISPGCAWDWPWGLIPSGGVQGECPGCCSVALALHFSLLVCSILSKIVEQLGQHWFIIFFTFSFVVWAIPPATFMGCYSWAWDAGDKLHAKQGPFLLHYLSDSSLIYCLTVLEIRSQGNVYLGSLLSFVTV